MKLFDHRNRDRNAATRALFARFEILYTIVDFSAAACFIVGSVLFFYADWAIAATWLFLIGSVFFALKPTLRLIREFRLYRMGQLDDLARRERSEI